MESSDMCDYSLHSVKSRPARVGDKLTTSDFRTGTRGFAAAEDANVAVCVRPGTELSFAAEVACFPTGLFAWRGTTIKHSTAIFRQVNKDKIAAHHDALEFPDGRIVLLTLLKEGQQATVLQLPAEPKTEVEAQAQQRCIRGISTRPIRFHSGQTRSRAGRVTCWPCGGRIVEYRTRRDSRDCLV